MDALLRDARAFVADVRAVIVVAEENRSGHVLAPAKHGIVIAQHCDALAISLRTLKSAGAVTVLGDDDRLVGEGLMNLVEITSQVGGSAFVPALVILVPHDVI